MYQFRELSENDIPVLYTWANQEHVKPWWKTDADPEKFKERYVTNLKTGKFHAYLVSLDDKPIGYAHYWSIDDDPQFKHLYPKNSVRMGQLIGEPSVLRQGHGAKLIKEFTDKLLHKSDVQLVMATVDVNNTAAIKSYKRAGFRRAADMDTTNGKVALLERKRLWKLSSQS